ncbi:DUF5590 domain-containing protein [Streptococcus tangpeifui]|uniref:cell wall elongation regulator TseB-like domain-containing protein n=1 Tax=Streptococcus tangpeifui TaxID=2709400 RepID=UPI0013ED8172|nr:MULTISPECIES: DUF5590 domain-containing protein [unclassified Streptococcus]
MEEPKKRHFWRYFISVLLILVLALAGAISFLIGATKPQKEMKTEAIKTARQYADFSSISTVQQYNGKEVFYTVFGQDESGQRIMVTINKKHSGQVYVYHADQGISSKDAQRVAKSNGAETIQKTTFGMAEGVPVWEVRSDGAYYLVNFETGDLIKREGL